MKIKITAESINEFLKITGDTNKVHYDDEYAKKLNFDGRVAPGMLTASLVLHKFYSPAIRNAFDCLKIRWNAPVYPGDLLLPVSSSEDSSLEIKVFNQNNAQVMNIAYMKSNESAPPNEIKNWWTEKSKNLGKSYSRIIGREDVANFNALVGDNLNDSLVPDLLISSLIPPSLLKWSGGEGLQIMQDIKIFDQNPSRVFGKLDVAASSYFRARNGKAHKGIYICESAGRLLQAGTVMCSTHDNAAQ